MIPTAGFLGFEGLELKLIDEVTKEEFLITPLHFGKEHSRRWVENFIDTPQNQYRLVATDTSDDFWFAFASPRSVGKLTYYSKILMNEGRNIWKIGLILILISLRHKIITLITVKE